MRDMVSHEALSYCRDRWQVDELGQLLIGDTSVRDAVDIAGGTPAYLYDRGIIAEAVREVRTALPGAELLYSLKANPFQPLLGFLATLVEGFDVASGGELIKAVCAGRGGGCIQFSGPGKDRNEIRQAMAANALLNVESARQVSEIADTAASLGREPEVILRINPGSLPGWGALRMEGAASQFGIDVDDVADVVAVCRGHDIEPLGFHFYWGTQSLDGERIAAAQRDCWRIACALSEANRVNLRLVNLGGGFGIPYYRGDNSLGLEPIEEAVAEVREELMSREPAARLMLELGRYVVGTAGIYVTTVLDIKQSGGIRIAVTDGGMHQHLAASGNLGQGVKRSFPCAAPTKMLADPTEQFRLVGRLCTPLDVLCPEAWLPELAPGDLVAIFQSGAYGATASPQAFLGHRPVGELLL